MPGLNRLIVKPESDGATVDEGFVVGGPVGDFELLLCHGTACIVRRMRDLILRLSKSSIYSTKPNLSCYFRYPATIRKVIYTTNAIESVHRQFRKLTKTKGAFPNENSLLKLLYLGLLNAQEKWTMPIQSWNLTLSQLAIYFEGRLDKVITL
ncbi:transposase [Klebsiella quasipneumoniae]